ncbi:hypothetical protein [Tropicimonas sediminicola]|uniref:Uncharacterized protein n=1 Tax=Tropicimonas sediminicola TaxID=1031541 RepID=A0A239IY86_9RHOB|nr:hypothetical protein [Tropicimonas sediminicola]SNS98485.1 hypothetical protein SAMN05421757_1058 [Tropicimonas sediminicola]
MESSDDQAIRSASAAAGRLFRTYERHCIGPSSDTLFDLLTAMHSLNDRLQRAVGKDFHHVEEFVALKAIRNLAHHQEELRSNVRVIPAPAYSDLAIMCILRRDQVERAIENSQERWRNEIRAACEAVFHWYGQAVNINPCVFNFMVKAYEEISEVGVRPAEEDIASFENSYRNEEAHGHSHFVEGILRAPAAEITGLLASVADEMPSAGA